MELDSFDKRFRDGVKKKKTYRDFRYLPALIGTCLNIGFMAGRAYRNCFDIQVRKIDAASERLPQAFDGYRILFMSDLHIDSLPGLVDVLMKKLCPLDYDLALMGGDYRFRGKGGTGNMERKLRRLMQFLNKKSRVIGVLGNHDEYSIAGIIEEEGGRILFNESETVKSGKSSIYIVGVDDSFYYNSSDVEEAFRDIPGDGCSVFLSHSPELMDYAEAKDASLALSGHTHGGQICLPGGIPVISGMKIEREKVYGLWMQGNTSCYTSSGVGISLYPARIYCKPEVVVFTLRAVSS